MHLASSPRNALDWSLCNARADGSVMVELTWSTGCSRKSRSGAIDRGCVKTRRVEYRHQNRPSGVEIGL